MVFSTGARLMSWRLCVRRVRRAPRGRPRKPRTAPGYAAHLQKKKCVAPESIVDYERSGGTMDTTTVRVVCGVIAVILLAVIIMRRRGKKEE